MGDGGEVSEYKNVVGKCGEVEGRGRVLRMPERQRTDDGDNGTVTKVAATERLRK